MKHILMGLVLFLSAAPTYAQTQPPTTQVTADSQATQKLSNGDFGIHTAQTRDANRYEPIDSRGVWLTMLIKMTLVLGAVILLAYLLLNKALPKVMKLSGMSSNKTLKILERLPVSNKHMLILVEASGKKLLIGYGDHSMNLIQDLSLTMQPDLGVVDPVKPFAQVLKEQTPSSDT